MPLTFNVFTAPDQVKMKWREVYLTEGLNRHFAVVVPRGIYQGFRLIPSAVNLTVTVAADPASGLSTLLYETSDGYSLAVRAAAFDVDLTPLAGTADPVIIAIDADYAVGVTTYANLMVYTQAEFAALPAAEQEEKIILGEVLVPLAGLIPAADITTQGRREAWEQVAPSAKPWIPLIKNPGFEWSVDNEHTPGAVAFWDGQEDANINFIPTSTYPTASGNRSLLVRQIAGAGINAVVFQRLGLPVQPGQHLKVRLSKQVTLALTAGTVPAGLNFSDANGQGTTFVSFDIPAAAPDAAWVVLEHTFEVPAGAHFLTAFGVGFTGAIFAANGDALLLDDVQVWLEAPSDDPTQWPIWTSGITIGKQNQSTLGLADLAAHLDFDRTTPATEGSLIVERRDRLDDTLLPPALALMGRLFLGQAASLLPTDAVALLARISAPVSTAAGVERTLLWESSSLVPLRMYGTATGGFEFTNNARWDGTRWTKDTAGAVASKLWLEGGDLFWYVRDAVNNAPWNDLAAPRWDRMSVMDVSGNLAVDAQISTGWHLATGTDDAAATPRLSTVLNPPAVSDYVLLWESADSSGVHPHVRIYAGGLGSLLLTTNARWGSTSTPTDNRWNKDVAGVNATAAFFGLDPTTGATADFIFARRFTDAAWADSQWEEHPINLLGAAAMLVPFAEQIPQIQMHTKPDTVTGSSGRTLLFEALPNGANTVGGVRFYAVNKAGVAPYIAGGLEITLNARWDKDALGPGVRGWVTDATGGGTPSFKLAILAADLGANVTQAAISLFCIPIAGSGAAFADSVFANCALVLNTPTADGTTKFESFGWASLFGNGRIYATGLVVVSVAASHQCTVPGETYGGIADFSKDFPSAPSALVFPGGPSTYPTPVSAPIKVPAGLVINAVNPAYVSCRAALIEATNPGASASLFMADVVVV